MSSSEFKFYFSGDQFAPPSLRINDNYPSLHKSPARQYQPFLASIWCATRRVYRMCRAALSFLFLLSRRVCFLRIADLGLLRMLRYRRMTGSGSPHCSVNAASECPERAGMTSDDCEDTLLALRRRKSALSPYWTLSRFATSAPLSVGHTRYSQCAEKASFRPDCKRGASSGKISSQAFNRRLSIHRCFSATSCF